MRSVDAISIAIVLGLIISSQGLATEGSNNTSFTEPKPHCSPLQISEVTPLSKEINDNVLWLADPYGGYCHTFCASLKSGEQIKAELVPAVGGNLTVYVKHLYGEAGAQDMGHADADKRYSFWVRADQLEDGEPWYNELWYGVDGKESNHVWYYIYDDGVLQYFRYNRSAVV